MAVGRTLAGRQAHRRAGEQADWRADEQARSSRANYCIAPLYDATRGQKAALRSAARMGGGVCGRRGWGDVEKRRGKRRDERTISKEEVAVSSYSC